MTETEWLTGDEPAAMLEFVRARLSERKARLIVCQVLRRANLQGAEVRQSIELGERLADGLAAREEARAFSRKTLKNRTGTEWTALTTDSAHSIAVAIGSGNQYARSAPFLLRECVGNPFRPVALDPAWLTSTVVALATGIYDDKAFDRMPILADALQDAGCDNDDILSHCREPGEHVRGCWVIDLLTGRS